jgi:pyruvate carboxylase subunit B
MVLGYFGKTPVPASADVIKLAAEQLEMEPTTRNPIEMNDENPDKGVDAAKKVLTSNGLDHSDENIFIAATCGEKGLAFLRGEAELGVRKNLPKDESEAVSDSKNEGAFQLNVSGLTYQVAVDGDKVTVNGRQYDDIVGEHVETESKSEVASGGGGEEITSQMPGKVLRVNVSVGDSVTAGDAIMVIEAMKMEVAISSVGAGKVASINVSVGDHIQTGELLATLS